MNDLIDLLRRAADLLDRKARRSDALDCRDELLERVQELTKKQRLLPHKQTTNVDFITALMTGNCPSGALIQPFVIEAVGKYAEMVVDAGPAAMDSPVLSGAAWVRTAEWAKSEIDKRYGASNIGAPKSLEPAALPLDGASAEAYIHI